MNTHHCIALKRWTLLCLFCALTSLILLPPLTPVNTWLSWPVVVVCGYGFGGPCCLLALALKQVGIRIELPLLIDLIAMQWIGIWCMATIAMKRGIGCGKGYLVSFPLTLSIAAGILSALLGFH